MGKMALAQYRARKARNAPTGGKGWPKGKLRILSAPCEAVFRDGRTVTRIIAALIHNIPIGVIAHDLRIPRRAVSVIDMREKQL